MFIYTERIFNLSMRLGVIQKKKPCHGYLLVVVWVGCRAWYFMEALGWCFSFFVFLNETLVRGLFRVIS